ncbi:hypothetical protein E5A74_02815 [Sphingomonas naasensis]|uniref:Haem-binding uptake Tiki superfamily ChaN domain-containing protein n=1 Tax=Sphingomonas naasensis TaxID=1344951 RepID=A0A4S1WRV5_9SPHN|nr:hypothetical protein [Sphingomonas naasensis]TGX46114.1 hypothetical protein E5A74_02815 [Sphingomonas naasensis]
MITADVAYLLFGEYHGTVEMPGVVADALCSGLATRRPVILGIEMDQVNQPSLDAWLASDGGTDARAALLAAPAWSEAGGRTTEAILGLLDSARRLARAGRDVTLLAFDPVSISGTSAEREAGMARLLRVAVERRPNSLAIALTGVGHAGKTRWTSYGPPFDALGALLPGEKVLTFAFVRPGGSYWGCQSPEGKREGCKPYAMPVREPVAPRGVRRDSTAREGFDGIYSAGTAYTASGPAKGDRTLPK